MRKSIATLVMFLSLCGAAQTDTSAVNDILNKLRKLEEMAAKDSSVNPLKVITDPNYGKKIVETPTNAEKIAEPAIKKTIKPIENKPKDAELNTVVKEETIRYITKIDTTILQPVIHFDVESVNLGSVTQGDKVKQRFAFVNKGNDDLEIINVVPDCSCTSPEWSEGKIKPGQAGYIIATYDTTEDIGKFLKTITVLHNSGEGWSFLEMTGFVAPKL